MVKRDQINLKESFSNHVVYNHQRRDLFHLWSAKNFGHAFGMREYSKFLSLKESLEFPIDLIEDVLEGYARGTEELAKLRKEAADKAAREAASGVGLNTSEQAAIAAAKRGDRK